MNSDRFTNLKRYQRILASSSKEVRDKMLITVADALEANLLKIEKANNLDIEVAKKGNIAPPLIKRLLFDENKLKGVCEGIRQVATLKDPIGIVKERRLLDEGLLLERVGVPIGVIGMIFESRPDALVQIISLALKSGNGIILKGGKEALNTNIALVEIIKDSLESFDAKGNWIVHLTSREEVGEILELDEIVDLLIPRGSNEFVRYIMDNTKIPVLGHADGICSLYVDKESSIEMAVKVAVDSKCQYPAVCNAIETLLVHKDVASTFLPKFKEGVDPYNVVIHGDEQTLKIIDGKKATESNWATEYLDYEIAIRVVDSVDQAIEHIATYNSGHTDAIVTTNEDVAKRFLTEVDSADVFWNASTRFADGFRFGLGAEVGISTQKIHARGPVGLNGLITDKWLIKGSGQIVDSYEKGVSTYKHKDLELEGDSILQG